MDFTRAPVGCGITEPRKDNIYDFYDTERSTAYRNWSETYLLTI